MNSFSIAILAGGMSKRFGSDKSFAMINGKTFIEILLENGKKLTDDIIIVTKNRDKFRFYDDVAIVEDLLPIQTPLLGILTGLYHARHDRVFISSVDSPLIKAEAIKIIIESMESFDAVIPDIDGKIHPLIAAYNRSIFEKLNIFIEKGNLKVRDFLSELSIKYIKSDQFLMVDPDLASFKNFNTKDELEKYKIDIQLKNISDDI
ncbi:MAG: molybdenum cofactor guanylyltransferase [Calditerrivibrio sp.]|nr:molybdenum cofactor guanylyltransferase [Calditerrivibrio sp.]